MQPDHAISCNIMQCSVKNWNRSRMNHQRYQSLAEKPWSQVARTCDAAQTRENSGKSTVWWAQVGIGQKKLKKNKVLHNDFNLRKIIHQNHWFWSLSSRIIAASMDQTTSRTKDPWTKHFSQWQKTNHEQHKKSPCSDGSFWPGFGFEEAPGCNRTMQYHVISCNAVWKTETGIAWTTKDIKAWLKSNDPRLKGHATQHKQWKIQ